MHDIVIEGLSEDQTQQVRDQLERILESKPFASSKRYGPLLRSLVERALDPEASIPKERTIGIEVFDRSPHYDTATDPIVRVAIGEVRKRLAQYYYGEAHRQEVHIELLPGLYQPKFAFPEQQQSAPRHTTKGERLLESAVAGTEWAAYPALGALPLVKTPQAAAHPARPHSQWFFLLLAALGLAAAPFSPVLWLHAAQDPERAVDGFLSPIFFQQRQPVFVIGTSTSVPGSPVIDATFDPRTVAPVPTHLDPGSKLVDHLNQMAAINLNEAAALAQISQMSGNRTQQRRLFSATATELADLRDEPVVLIGGLDNPWSLMFTRNLRFHFLKDPASRLRFYIEDAENPGNKEWGVNFDVPFSKATRDYALVARFNNEVTGQPTLIVGGLGCTGTEAAANFLTNPNLMDEVRRRTNPSSWRTGNFEIVLQLDAIGDMPTPPRIVAVATF